MFYAEDLPSLWSMRVQTENFLMMPLGNAISGATPDSDTIMEI